MKNMPTRLGALALATCLACAPGPSAALAPALLLMGKEMVRQIATSMIKDALLSGLSGMGCKGIALSRAIDAFDLRRAAGGGLPTGLSKMPTGTTMPSLPAGMAMPKMPGMPGMPNMPGMPAIPGMPGGMGGLLPGGGMEAEMAAKMGRLIPGGGGMPPGLELGPEDMAAFAQMQQAMANPLSPPETLAVIDELFELGFLPKAVQSEFKECMVLVPESVLALGMGMGMIKPIVPQLQKARRELHALSPADQDEMVAAMAQEMKSLPADERTALADQLDSGFFPPRMAAGLKARLSGK